MYSCTGNLYVSVKQSLLIKQGVFRVGRICFMCALYRLINTLPLQLPRCSSHRDKVSIVGVFAEKPQVKYEAVLRVLFKANAGHDHTFVAGVGDIVGLSEGSGVGELEGFNDGSTVGEGEG